MFLVGKGYRLGNRVLTVGGDSGEEVQQRRHQVGGGLKTNKQGSHSLTTCRTNSRGTPTKARKFLSLNIYTGLFLDLGRGEKEGNRDLVAKNSPRHNLFFF